MPSLIRTWILGLALVSVPSSALAKVSVERLEDENTVIIAVTGEIEAGDDDVFRKAALESDSAIVWLDSPGGALAPALAIGRMLRISEFPTVVADGSVCASSCALIWLAGSPRFLAPEGMVGFHASYREESGALIETGVGNAMVGHFLSQMNLPERAVIFATSASPHSITWLSSANKSASGIDFTVLGDTANVSPEKSARGNLDSLFRFTAPASCEMSDQMLGIFRGLVQMDQTTWEASQGKPIRLPGSSGAVTPTFSRNRESGDGYDAREVFASLPVNADWFGLPVREIQYVFYEQSSNYEYRILFDADASVVTQTLNRYGFELGKPGTPKTFNPEAAASYGMAILPLDRGSAWICGSRMFY